jgi:endonuclease-3
MFMDREEVRRRTARIIPILRKALDIDEGPPWNFREPFECLIGTVLSARTKDENTAKATAQLFRRYPDVRSLAKAPVREIEKLVRPSGFYRVKARRVKELARFLLDNHGGEVPDTMEELVKLPGVGRKTAGCVMVYAYGRPQIPVDVHVFRISNRIGLVKTRDPEETEFELMEVVPRDKWIILNHLFVRFGQQVCKPLRPECWRCPIEGLCEFPEKNLENPRGR